MFYSHSSAAPPMDVETEASEEDSAKFFAHIESAWNRLGAEAPHWSVLSSDAFKPDAIAQNERAFFASGVNDLGRIEATLKRNRINATRIHSVCEFGCGVGRVTAHLAQRFGHVYALDISENHLAIARKHAPQQNITWVKTTVERSTPPNLVDLWFSRLVLQHNPPPMIGRILQGAFASLSPGGLAMFQVPTYCGGYSFSISRYLERQDRPEIEMHVFPQQAIHALARAAGLHTLEVITDDDSIDGWTTQRFLLRRPD